jgi:cell division protein FtsI/penicillin-binding protein 2
VFKPAVLLKQSLNFFNLSFFKRNGFFEHYLARPKEKNKEVNQNYGQVADNLPPPSATAKLLQSTSIQKVRLYGSDPAIIKALANTGIGIVIGASNGDISALASDPNFTKN